MTTTNQQPSSNKDIIFWIICLMFAASLVGTYIHGQKQKEEEITVQSYNHKELIDSISALNISQAVFRAENKVYYQSFRALLQDKEELKQVQRQISRTYAKLQDEIANANDTIQSIITNDLLARHRNLPLERNQ